MGLTRKTALVIMDGWGHGQLDETNAIFQAKTPFIDSLYKSAPNTQLITDGEAVGLPAGQMGNSEVGHLNLGAGRIVYQELLRVNRALASNELASNPALQQALSGVQEGTLHLLGLVSDGGVHAHIDHLIGLCRLASDAGVKRIRIHAFTDGRDTDPHGGLRYLTDLEQGIQGASAAIATLCGRYYAMDRDRRWERTARAHQLLTQAKGRKAANAIDALQHSYDQGVSDEFVEPALVAGVSHGTISEGDTLLFFNFRTDRCRQLLRALTMDPFPDYDMKPLGVRTFTMTVYDKTFTAATPLFHNDPVPVTLGEVVARAGGRQLRAAETEKYPHVTYFFSGGREEPFEQESRVLLPSPKVATYDMQPEMSAIPLTDQVISHCRELPPDFACINFANCDMVGHTGDFKAAMKAAETVDACVKKLIGVLTELDYTIFLTADHGNADYMVNPDGSPNTAHSLNKVPLFVINHPNKVQLQPGKLGDIAPTMLGVMGLPVPEEMTGNRLLQEEAHA